MNVAIGIDLGGTNIKYGLITEKGDVIKKISLPTRRNSGERQILSDIAAEVVRLQQEFMGQNTYKMLGIGVGIPGPVRADGYVETCVNLNFKKINPAEALSEMLKDMPIVVGNDANVAALGEMWLGGGKGYKNILVVTLGTGVGCGVVLNGRIVFGKAGLAGEIGHIIVNPNEVDQCNCGKRGCLDQFASAEGIVRNAKRILEFSSMSSELRNIPKDELTAEKIVNIAKNGDGLAYFILDYCMSFLGKCLADTAYVIDPDVFVIGGGVSKAGAFLTDMIQKHYEKQISLSEERTPVIVAQLGNDAGIYGAARMVFDKET
ncbi:MAG: ROK family glucokinase [Lachnospiraceae bacterium]|nr:ROK family glucokinase [Lachnospiraceae bacterium]